MGQRNAADCATEKTEALRGSPSGNENPHQGSADRTLSRDRGQCSTQALVQIEPGPPLSLRYGRQPQRCLRDVLTGWRPWHERHPFATSFFASCRKLAGRVAPSTCVDGLWPLARLAGAQGLVNDSRLQSGPSLSAHSRGILHAAGAQCLSGRRY